MEYIPKAGRFQDKRKTLFLLTAALLTAAGAAYAQSPIGWASQNGGTTGGAGGTVVTVTSETDLINNSKSSSPMIIKISGKISCDRVNITSNKTIEGAAAGATVAGSLVLYGKAGAIIKNVIIRNLTIAPESGSFPDALSMQFAENIWVDHCDVSDKRSTLDGLCDMTHACDYITVSWTKFSYPTSTPDHRLCMLISASDESGAEDRGKLRITLHHNWWAQNVRERMPRMRFGKVHSFNNYFSSSGNNYCIGAGVEAQVRVESNYFDGVKDPHIFYDGETTAIIFANTDNQYISTTGTKDNGHGACFTPPYQYSLDVGSTVKANVVAGAGPFKTVGLNYGALKPLPAQKPAAKTSRMVVAVTMKGSRLPVGATRAAAPSITITDKPVLKVYCK